MAFFVFELVLPLGPWYEKLIGAVPCAGRLVFAEEPPAVALLGVAVDRCFAIV